MNAICPGTVETPSWHDRVNQSEDPDTAKRNFIARQVTSCAIELLELPTNLHEVSQCLEKIPTRAFCLSIMKLCLKTLQVDVKLGC